MRKFARSLLGVVATLTETLVSVAYHRGSFHTTHFGPS
jgi:hypothetical protein